MVSSRNQQIIKSENGQLGFVPIWGSCHPLPQQSTKLSPHTQMVPHSAESLHNSAVQTFDRGAGLGLDCWWPHLPVVEKHPWESPWVATVLGSPPPPHFTLVPDLVTILEKDPPCGLFMG